MKTFVIDIYKIEKFYFLNVISPDASKLPYPTKLIVLNKNKKFNLSFIFAWASFYIFAIAFLGGIKLSLDIN